LPYFFLKSRVFELKKLDLTGVAWVLDTSLAAV